MILLRMSLSTGGPRVVGPEDGAGSGSGLEGVNRHLKPPRQRSPKEGRHGASGSSAGSLDGRDLTAWQIPSLGNWSASGDLPGLAWRHS